MNLLEANNLSREFKVVETDPGFFNSVKSLIGINRKKIIRAVEDAAFNIEKGEIVGLIGPNGAGKSTIVKMAVGIIPPTSGEIKTFGLNPVDNRIEIARRYGAVFGQRSILAWNLSAKEVFESFASIYDLEPLEARRQIDFLIGHFELEKFITTPVRQLSLGQRVKCELAGALIHKPELLFLDEPTIGLDVVTKNHVREYINMINKEQGVTVLLTSHDMVDVERLCGRVLIIDKGKFVYNGPLDPLRESFAPERIMTLFLENAVAPSFNINGAEVVRVEGEKLVLKFNSKEKSSIEILEAVSAKCEVLDFSVTELPIDEVIARIYRTGFSGKNL